MANENLKKVKDEIYNCSVCGQCVKGPVDPLRPNPFFEDYLPEKVCPMRENHRFLTYSGSGMNSIARALLEGRLEISDELVKAVSECVLCGHCVTNCGEVFNVVDGIIGKRPEGHGVDTPEVVRAMKADFVKAGKEPIVNVKKVAAAIEKGHNRFARAQSDRKAWTKDVKIADKANLLFYVGCTASYKNTEIARSFAKILNKAGVDFTILGEKEWCCGGPQLLNAGLVDQFEAHVKHNVEAIRATGAKEVVATCADCYRTLKFDYPKVVGELGFKVMHSSQLLARLIEEKRSRSPRK